MKAHLERHDPSQNIAHYYRMSVLPNLFGEWTLRREWGRIGRSGQVRMGQFSVTINTIRAKISNTPNLPEQQANRFPEEVQMTA
jgi:predicted DNA-binding WGR domain protein